MTIAISGATGFLGLRLLPMLMERGCPIVVLAHAGTAPATDRIKRHLRGIGAPTDGVRELTVVPISLTRPLLGLQQKEFQDLGQRLTEIWHCAGSIDLLGTADQVRPTNVAGVHNVLALAGVSTPALYHVSTAFVAGGRTTGLIGDDDLDRSYGFESAYEESKFDGEQAIREWSRRSGRPATVFRPSILVTDRPPPPGGAAHPLLVAFRLSNRVESMVAVELAVTHRLPVRVAADPDAHLNFIPVELAARLMVALAERPHPGGVVTAHVTYPHDVSVATILSLFEQRFPVELKAVAKLPPDPTLPESLVAEQMRGFAPCLFHHRYFDRAALRTAGLDQAEAPPLDSRYLMSGTERPNRQFA